MGLPCGTSGKEPACQCRLDIRYTGSTPGWGRSPEEGNVYPLPILAWRIPWTEEPDGLQLLGSQSQMRLSDSTNGRNLSPLFSVPSRPTTETENGPTWQILQ